MAGSKFTHLSSYYTDHSGLSSSVFHWIRSIPFVFYALRPCLLLDIFYVQENSCILKIKSCILLKKMSFQVFCGYFICFLFLLLLPLQDPSSLCAFPSNRALFHSLQFLANIVRTKQHFAFYIN